MTSRTGDVVVCDASPLIVLARVEHLDLLRQLFGRVLVPPAVWSEVTHRPHAPGASAVARAEWIQVRAPSVVPTSKLGLGEREGMGLAAELHALTDRGRWLGARGGAGHGHHDYRHLGHPQTSETRGVAGGRWADSRSDAGQRASCGRTARPRVPPRTRRVGVAAGQGLELENWTLPPRRRR